MSTTPLERYLAEQADLAPVERFSLCEVPDRGTWQDRIPLTAPLPGRERELLALKYGAGMTNRTISEITGISESNVGTVLHRTVRALRERW